MESEPGVINPLDSIWALLRMSPAFLLRDARRAMHSIFFVHLCNPFRYLHIVYNALFY